MWSREQLGGVISQLWNADVTDFSQQEALIYWDVMSWIKHTFDSLDLDEPPNSALDPHCVISAVPLYSELEFRSVASLFDCGRKLDDPRLPKLLRNCGEMLGPSKFWWSKWLLVCCHCVIYRQSFGQ